jgi:hypothetical protein
MKESEPVVWCNPSVDRLDHWLNGRTGWCRGVLTWLQMCPAAIILSCAAWDFSAHTASPLLSNLLIFEEISYSFIGAVPLTVLYLLLYRSPAGRFISGPILSWRRLAGIFLWMVAFLLEQIGSHQRFRSLHYLEYVYMILVLVGARLLMLNYRRYKRSKPAADIRLWGLLCPRPPVSPPRGSVAASHPIGGGALLGAMRHRLL